MSDETKRCDNCKHETYSENRAHRQQCLKHPDVPIWVAFNEKCEKGKDWLER